MPIRIHSYALNSRDVHTTVSWTPQFGCFHWHLFGIGMKTDLFQSCGHCWVLLFMGFSRQEYWSGLPFPSPVDHILSDLSTMTRPSWVVPRAWLSFIELDKAVVLVWLDWLVFCDYGFSVSALWCPLATKVCLVKAMVFPVVMYGCESWTIKKTECWGIDAFELWCWRRL